MVPLPPGLEEASGVAPGLEPGVVWSHNDSGGQPLLWAVHTGGELRGRVRLGGARNVDWEDLAEGPCGRERCLYVADTGDNREVRSDVGLYRIPLPPAADDTVRAEHIPLRLPGGPRDVEALLVLPDETLLLVTKGRNHPLTLYRYPPPLRPNVRVTLEEVQTLSEGPPAPNRWITGGAVDASGRLAVLRTLRTLTFFRVAGHRLEPLSDARVHLGSLREPLGEGVAFLDEQNLALTSEAGILGSRGGLRILRCPGLPSF